MKPRGPRGVNRPPTADELFDEINLKTKRAIAALAGNALIASHQARDRGLNVLDSLTALGGLALLADAGTRFLVLRSVAEAHFGNASTPTRDGVHNNADGFLGVDEDVSSLPNLITRIGELKTALIAHATGADVHFGDDADLAALVIVPDPPTNQAQANGALDDILLAMQAHLERHMESIYA